MGELYENEDVLEPTCAGYWWRGSPDSNVWSVSYVSMANGVKPIWWPGTLAVACREEGVVWAGPIPSPEDKLWPYGHASEALRAGAAENAPSEDEGEKWGKLFCNICYDACWGLPSWEDSTIGNKRQWKEMALRFRAKCVAPLEKAAREVMLAYRGYGDIAGGAFKTTEDLRAAELKVQSEVGLAIEHLDDALEALTEHPERGRPARIDDDGQVETGMEDN